MYGVVKTQIIWTKITKNLWMVVYRCWSSRKRFLKCVVKRGLIFSYLQAPGCAEGLHYKLPSGSFSYREKAKSCVFMQYVLLMRLARVCQSLGILQTGKLTLIHAIWFQSVPPRATPRGNLVRSCGIISRIDISQNPRLPSPTLSPTIDHTYVLATGNWI